MSEPCSVEVRLPYLSVHGHTDMALFKLKTELENRLLAQRK